MTSLQSESSTKFAATNNMAMLAFSIFQKVKELNLPPKDQDKFCHSADTILNLCAAQAVCTARVLTWATVFQHQVWVCLSASIPE